MDKVFEKFGIYDFFGIWGPGAITVTYYYFTLHQFLLNIFEEFGIAQINLSQGQRIIILYSVGAYLAGVILHEIGKLIADVLPWFNINTVNERIRKKVYKKKPCLNPWAIIKYNYQYSCRQNNIDFEKGSYFEKAVNRIKYNKDNISTKRIDKHHSIYALSRSLCLCFLGHIVLLLASVFLSENHSNINWWWIVIDLCLLMLFFIRTYRYFLSWIKNVYTQYSFIIRNKQS